MYGSRLTSLAHCLVVAAASSAALAGPDPEPTPETYFVGPAGTDNGTCGTTRETPCRSIQFAYAERAVAGDEVRVLPGIYSECIGAVATFGGESGPKPVEFVADAFLFGRDIGATVISGASACGPASKTPGAVVTLAGDGAKLVGFTVTGGGGSGVVARGPVTIENNILAMNSTPVAGGGIRWRADTCEFGDVEATISENQIRMNQADGDGGGIDALASSSSAGKGCVAGTARLTISENVVEWNDSNGLRGGGISARAESVAGLESSVVASDNLLVGNRVLGPASARGGGLWAGTSGPGRATVDLSFNVARLNRSTGPGAGIAVEAAAESALGSRTGGSSLVTLLGNNIESNEAAGATGAGMSIQTATSAGASAAVEVESNRIVGNRFAAGVTGDGGGLGAMTSGEGEETIEVSFNELSFNAATGNGGGAFVGVAAVDASVHSVVFDRNTVASNLAAANGGGVQISVTVPKGRSPGLAASRLSNNVIRANESRTEDFDSPLGGGGALAVLDIAASGAGSAGLQVTGNTFSQNRSSRAGGGLTLHSRIADDEPGNDPLVARIATASNLFSGNLVDDGVGGAVYALLESTGASRAETTIDLSTFSANRSAGGGAGVHVESLTGSASLGDSIDGAALASIRYSIFDRNTGFAIGGPRPGDPGLYGGGSGNLRVDSITNDFFSNTSGAFEPTLLDPAPPPPEPPALRESGTLTLDPRLDEDFDHELCIRIGRASASSLADVNADAIVDGVDIALVAEAFGASAPNGRYSALADIDGNAIVDGDDLAIAVGSLADTCPEE